MREATVGTAESRVTRSAPTETDTGDGGVRFAGFFGPVEKRNGTSIVTEVFALGPHLVYPSGEGDDLDEAGRLADAAIADAVSGRP